MTRNGETDEDTEKRKMNLPTFCKSHQEDVVQRVKEIRQEMRTTGSSNELTKKNTPGKKVRKLILQESEDKA